MKSHPKKALFLVTIILLICLLILLSTNSIGFALLALILLVLSMRQFFLPTAYTLTTEGVEVRFSGATKKRSWGYFSSYYEDLNGVLLSPFKGRSRLEAFRGVYLIANNNKPQIVEFIRQSIKQTRY